MANRYHCPHCHGVLNPGTKVIFVVENEERRTLLLLSPELGDYAYEVGREMVLAPGALCTFRCPVCHADLTSELDDRLVDIDAHAPDGAVSRVSFSRRFGEQATFVRTSQGMQQYGEHAEHFEPVNFFGAGDVKATES